MNIKKIIIMRVIIIIENTSKSKEISFSLIYKDSTKDESHYLIPHKYRLICLEQYEGIMINCA